MGFAVSIDPNLIQGVGEFSVSYVPGLNRWILLVGGTIVLAAVAPWGPFQLIQTIDPTTVSPPNSFPLCSGLYGEYIVDRFGEWDADSGIATSYYYLSSIYPASCDFYGVVMMRMTLGCS